MSKQYHIHLKPCRKTEFKDHIHMCNISRSQVLKNGYQRKHSKINSYIILLKKKNSSSFNSESITSCLLVTCGMPFSNFFFYSKNPQSWPSALASYLVSSDIPTLFSSPEMALYLGLNLKKIFSIISLYKKLTLETPISLNRIYLTNRKK